MKKNFFYIVSITALMTSAFQSYAAEPNEGLKIQIDDAFEQRNGTVFTITGTDKSFIYYTIQRPSNRAKEPITTADVIPGTILGTPNFHKIESTVHKVTRWCLYEAIRMNTMQQLG